MGGGGGDAGRRRVHGARAGAGQPLGGRFLGARLRWPVLPIASVIDGGHAALGVMEDSAHDQARSLPIPAIMLATGPEAIGVEIISDARCVSPDWALAQPRGLPVELLAPKICK